MEKYAQPLRYFVLATFVVLLAFLLFWRVQVSQHRFLDVDEFTHLNWAASIARGEKPYIDFFTFFTPGFHFVYGTLIKIGAHDGSIFLQARFLSLLIFMANLITVGALFVLLRGKLFALLALIFFAWLPMPYDKLLEIRPDNLSLLFFLIGLVIQVYLLTRISNHKGLLYGLVGIFYACSLIVLVKNLPLVGLACLFLLFSPESMSLFRTFLKTKRLPPWREVLATPVSALLGLLFVSFVFLIYLVSLGNFSMVYYSLVRLPLESSFALGSDVMESHLFFFPNSSFYGPKENLTAFYFNHFIWLIAIFFGSFRLLTPFLTAKGKRGVVASEVLFGSLFVLSCYLYIEFYPLKHTQYLIPISVFVAWYSADFFRFLFDRKMSLIKGMATICICLIGAYYLITSTIHVNAQKKMLNNDQQVRETNQLLELIPKDQKVFDLEGRTVFWKPAYYICCLPFGSYVYNLSQQPEPVRTILERDKIEYIFQGYSGRIYVFPPEDYAYIYANYEAVPGWESQLFRRRSSPIIR